MDEEFGPVDEARVDLRERVAIVLGQLDLLPELRGHVLAFDGLHVEVDGAGFGIAADGGVAGVGEGAGLTVTESGDVVFGAAEVLLFWGSG